MTRGIEINNPGNIRISPAHWVGKVTPSRDPDFETFDTPEHGMRAMAKILLTDFREHGLKTIAGIVRSWAPPSENHTAAYAKSVSDRTGYGLSEELEPDADTLSDLVYAIAFQEQGYVPYSDDQIGAAVDDALGVDEEGPATHNID